MFELKAMSFNQTDVDWQQARDFVQGNQSLFLVFVGTILLGCFSLKAILSPTIPTVKVPLPPQAQKGWTGTTLDQPSIQGEDPAVIQCYCPATAQLIDTIKAATIDDVDTAIDKAKAAQLKWRRTSFKQRVLVLKALLKFIVENQGLFTIPHLLKYLEDIVRVSCRDSGVGERSSTY